MLADASAVTQNANQHLSGSAAGLDALVDTDAIFCYQCVRRMNEQVRELWMYLLQLLMLQL